MKQFFAILAIGLVLIGGYVFYVHWSRTRALESGDVVELNQPADTASPASPPPEAAKSEATPDSVKPATIPSAEPAKAAAPETAKTTPPPSPSKTPPPQELALNGGGPLQLHPQTAKPAADMLPQLNKDGTVYTDKGRFQLYRQGDITWRMNTQTGKACVFLATEAQWSKTVVYQNGCGGR
jgi:hypothetical protein